MQYLKSSSLKTLTLATLILSIRSLSATKLRLVSGRAEWQQRPYVRRGSESDASRKLSYYSDVIEQHLIIEIGQASSSFFAALGNLNDLNAEAESCLRKIDALKSELELIHDNQARKACVSLESNNIGGS